MTYESLYYNFHDVLGLRINRPRRRDLARDLNLMFSFFQTDEAVQPDIILNIGKFAPSNHGCFVIGHKYHVRENYLYCRDAEGKARWEVEISGFEDGQTTVNYNGSLPGLPAILLPDYLPQTLFVRPLIAYKLMGKSCFMVHSAAVSKDGKAYLLAGRGGAYKTTMAMDFVRKTGFDFLSDDLAIINGEKVLSFPMHPALFHFRMKHLPTEDIGGFKTKLLLLRHLGLSRNKEYAKPAMSPKPAALFLVTKTNTNGVRISEGETRRTVSRLVTSMEMEMINSPTMAGMNFGRYHQYMTAYSFVFPRSKLATFYSDMTEGLNKALAGIPQYEISIPAVYHPDTFDTINQFVRNGAKL